jgi:hypothetical protein
MTTSSEAGQDIEFLVTRTMAAGCCDFTNERWTGMSSNSIVAVAYGMEQKHLPSDRSDWAACVRTFRRLPSHRRTPRVREAMAVAKAAYLKNYPDDASPSRRKAAHERWERERAEHNRNRKKGARS